MTSGKQLTVTEQRIVAVQQDLSLSEALAAQVLEDGIDYGLHPGTKSQALKDPGAATIINAFGCYPKAEVLYREVTERMISYVIDVQLVSRDDGQIKATGTGAASTMETKYGYRWVTDPEFYGYSRAELRQRKRGNEEQFRIVNPEWSELENTIIKMARKRAEVDAAMSLPGVSRFMARLNSKAPASRKAPGGPDDWTSFWSKVRNMGLTDSEAHDMLGVDSMKDWTAAGRTLDDAVRELALQVSRRLQPEEE